MIINEPSITITILSLEQIEYLKNNSDEFATYLVAVMSMIRIFAKGE